MTSIRPSAVARLALAASLLLAATLSQALTVTPYTPAALAAAQKSGEPLVLHFHAPWCPTCRAQDKAFDALKADPSLKVTLMEVDRRDGSGQVEEHAAERDLVSCSGNTWHEDGSKRGERKAREAHDPGRLAGLAQRSDRPVSARPEGVRPTRVATSYQSGALRSSTDGSNRHAAYFRDRTLTCPASPTPR